MLPAAGVCGQGTPSTPSPPLLCSYAWFALDVGEWGWLKGAGMWDSVKKKALPLGRLYATATYMAKGKKALPGVSPAAVATWPSNWPPAASKKAVKRAAASTSPALGAAQVGATPGLPDWDTGCTACTAAPDLSKLPAVRQRHCALKCGFWAHLASAGPEMRPF